MRLTGLGTIVSQQVQIDDLQGQVDELTKQETVLLERIAELSARIADPATDSESKATLEARRDAAAASSRRCGRRGPGRRRGARRDDPARRSRGRSRPPCRSRRPARRRRRPGRRDPRRRSEVVLYALVVLGPLALVAVAGLARPARVAAQGGRAAGSGGALKPRARRGARIQQLGEVAVRHARDRVGAAVVDGEAIRRRIDERRAREDHVRHVTDLLVRHLRREEVVAGTRDDAPRLVEVEQRRAHRVDEAVARGEDAVVDHEPALVGLDRDRAGADLRRLPAPGPRAHHVPVAAPVDQVGALREEDVAERRVAVVARPAQHQVPVSDPPREQDAVAVEGEVGVVELVERHEVVRVGDADRRPVVAVAPGHVVAILEPRHARVVGVLERALDLGTRASVGGEVDRLLVDLPVDPVGAPARVDVHRARGVVDAEDAGEAVSDRGRPPS